MALKKPTTQFENEPAVNENDEADVAVAERPAKVSKAAPDAPTAPATPEQEPEAAETEKPEKSFASSTHAAIAKVTSSVALDGAAAEAKRFQKEVDAMKGASDFSYGNYPVFKGDNGAIVEKGGEESDLGRWAQVRLLSWDDHYEISPGEQGASTKDFVAYSKDGITVDSVIGEELKSWIGKSVSDYAEHLRTVEEFDKTKVRRFLDTACALMACDSGDGPVGSVIQVTLSESSIPAFSRYQQSLVDTARCVSMGLPGFSLPADPFNFFFIREVAKKGNNTWTKLKISATLPVKL